MQHTFTYHQDPGHGWLQVPKRMLSDWGISHDISSYSYTDGEHVYLEEDCDMSRFLQEADKRGVTVHIKAEYQDNAPIRNMPCYRPG